MKNYKKKLIFLLFFLIILGVSLLVVKKIQVFRERAEAIPVEITIDGSSPKFLPRIWQNFAQGGEESQNMIEPVKNEVAGLDPLYIRIDHLFDFYEVVSRDSSGHILYNWEKLDKVVQEILGIGAIPFLSLSYLPPTLSSGSITSTPTSFNDWQNLIQATIEHYSGRSGKNIQNIYYEVWNEPDLFGQMNPQGYFKFYQSAARGAAAAKNTSPFKFGGPATIGINKTWMNNFLGAIKSSNIKFDFISWHSYSTNPQKIKLESQVIDSLQNFQSFKGKVEKIVSEWGSDSEMNPIHDSYFDASHTIAGISESLESVDRVFAFELKDGLSPNGLQFWGRWGLLTHQKVGLAKKPRYFAYTFLNKLQNFSLPSSQNSQFIYTLASSDGLGNYSILATFFPSSQSSQNKNLTIKISNFLPGEFTETTSFLKSGGNSPTSETKFTSNGAFWEKSLSLNSFSSVLVYLKRLSAAVSKAGGATTNPSDKSAHLFFPFPPLIYPLFSQNLENQETGQISFWIKPSWNGDDPNEYYLFETKLSPIGRFYALKEKGEGFTNSLKLVFEYERLEKSVSLNVTDWKKDNWYKITFTWDNPKMELTLKAGEKEEKGTLGVIGRVSLGKFIYVGSDYEGGKLINADIDNLKITINNQTVYEESFD